MKREGLQGTWMAFQQCLIDSDSMLKKHKVRYFEIIGERERERNSDTCTPIHI